MRYFFSGPHAGYGHCEKAYFFAGTGASDFSDDSAGMPFGRRSRFASSACSSDMGGSITDRPSLFRRQYWRLWMLEN